MLPVLARIAQRRQRVGGLARLRNEDRERARIERRLAVAELGGDIDFDRQVREPLEPVSRDHAGVIGGAAGGDRNALERAEIERQLHRQRDALGHHVEIMRERVADHFRLLVNFLRHEMAMVALVDEHHGRLRLEHVAVHDARRWRRGFRRCRVDDGAVAVLQIAHRVGEGRERDRVRAEIHRVVAEADRERRALAGADQQIFFAGKQEREREGAAQPRQRRLRPPRPANGPASISSVTRCATTSLSVSVANLAPLASSSRRNSLKFSMMPLCTTASRSVACGCALVSFGRPWVAQRVWPMPIVAVERLARELLFQISAACPRRAGASARRARAWRRRRNRSRDIRGA